MIKFKKSTFFLLFGLLLLEIPKQAIAQTQANIDPKAESILEEAVNYLKSAQSLNFKADITFEDIAPAGLKIQYHSTAQVFVDRPDRFQIDYVGDRRDVSFYYNGKDFILFDRRDNVYGTFAAPGTIDETLKTVAEDFGFVVPLADLAHSDPAGIFKGKIQRGYYLGLVRWQGKSVHHLAFVESAVDWQIWIEDGKQPLIRKLVITYKNLDASPQYIATFPEWNMNWRVPRDNFFSFKAPANAVKIDFLPSNQSFNP